MIILFSVYMFEVEYKSLVTITFTALIMIEFLNIYSIVTNWSRY